jgi:hypothetical protein
VNVFPDFVVTDDGDKTRFAAYVLVAVTKKKKNAKRNVTLLLLFLPLYVVVKNFKKFFTIKVA